jgi:hypothetical protein
VGASAADQMQTALTAVMFDFYVSAYYYSCVRECVSALRTCYDLAINVVHEPNRCACLIQIVQGSSCRTTVRSVLLTLI